MILGTLGGSGSHFACAGPAATASNSQKPRQGRENPDLCTWFKAQPSDSRAAARSSWSLVQAHNWRLIHTLGIQVYK